ncbi:MAG: isochorismate synthase, partial [Chlamydiae bacterium]|nr:isochorismate synthase [Chlamydiota bacterium]
SPEEAAFYLQEGCPQTPYEDNILLQCDDLPNKRQWHSLIKKAFESTSLKKVVLARMTSLRFKDMLHPLSLLTYLDTRTLNSTLFAYIPSKEKAFLGASPELFYKRQGSTLSTAAVAGTRKRGTSQQEDAFLENELLHSEKDLEEFAFVVRFFEETLSSGCTRLHPSATMVKKTSTVQHLYKPFEALLKYPFQDEALISVLHPTPAVGGTPRKEALQFLQESEPFYRGYYAAPLGWVSSSITELIVAIRSSLVLNNTLTLFAGAGITKASDPEKEWEELNHKIKPLSTAYACLS